MEEDWDSETGYSPATPQSWDVGRDAQPQAPIQTGRGRGFWNKSDGDTNWRKFGDRDGPTRRHDDERGSDRRSENGFGSKRGGFGSNRGAPRRGPSNFGNADESGDDRYAENGSRNERGFGRNRGDRSNFGRSNRNNDRGSEGFGRTREDEPSTEITIPSNNVGRIIGKGGSKIRELQDESGCRIHILKDSESYGEQSIKLIGSEEAQAKAKELIEELINPVERTRNSFAKTSISSEPQGYQEPPKPRINWSMIMKDKEENDRVKFLGLPDIKKNFYIESNDVANMHPDEVAEIRAQNNNIVVTNLSKKQVPANIPNPM